MKRMLFLSIIVFLSLVFLSFHAQAMPIIIYDVTDIGGGSWQYSYSVSNYTFPKDHGFTIFFDYGLYDNIIPISDNADWDEITWNPQLLLGGVKQAGAYDALALVDNASLSSPFIVQFEWLGSGVPGSQAFEIYDTSWNILQSGRTSSIPEPGTFLLFATLFSSLIFMKKKV